MALPIPFRKDFNPGSGENQIWWIDSHLSVWVRCPHGHVGVLDHEIDDQGLVSPSVICPNEDCDFHDWIILIDWDTL